MYFVITRNPDGEIYTQALNKTELEEWLEERTEEDMDMPTFVENLEQADPQYWKGEQACLILKGKIVVPKPKEVTTKYEI